MCLDLLATPGLSSVWSHRVRSLAGVPKVCVDNPSVRGPADQKEDAEASGQEEDAEEEEPEGDEEEPDDKEEPEDDEEEDAGEDESAVTIAATDLTWALLEKIGETRTRLP